MFKKKDSGVGNDKKKIRADLSIFSFDNESSWVLLVNPSRNLIREYTRMYCVILKEEEKIDLKEVSSPSQDHWDEVGMSISANEKLLRNAPPKKKFPLKTLEFRQ